ncbi:hypothetical protein [Bradyrhizobium erythrophlei]|uniref:hypothetical protein n=1 Tax=Bradyrhizobium erythrophlei TaxID=1437360 RepID=UPI0012AB8FCA|nr:hypothetical protein [Bradyrhizobium erythrophlei]
MGAALLAGLPRAANTFKIILILPTTSGEAPIGRPIDIITLCMKQGGDTSLAWPRCAGPRQFLFVRVELANNKQGGAYEVFGSYFSFLRVNHLTRRRGRRINR